MPPDKELPMKRERLEICWYALRPILIYLVLFITIRSILYRLLESILLGFSADMAHYYTVWNDIAGLMILALSSAGAFIPVMREGQREVLHVRARRNRTWICARRDSGTLIGVLPFGTICLSILLNLILASDTGTDLLRKAAIPMAAAVYGLLTPFIEEVLYRGILMHRLRRGFGPLQAALLSALIFGTSHGNLRQGIYGFVMGIVFAFGYELTGQFEVPFLLHSACNLTTLAGSAFGLFELLNSSMWMLFLAVGAFCTFVYWCRRLWETKYKL